MGSTEDYLQHAEECSALAQTTDDPDDKARLLQMAEAWRDLAERLRRLDKIRKSDEV
jgi:hypothetical protein